MERSYRRRRLTFHRTWDSPRKLRLMFKLIVPRHRSTYAERTRIVQRKIDSNAFSEYVRIVFASALCTEVEAMYGAHVVGFHC